MRNYNKIILKLNLKSIVQLKRGGNCFVKMKFYIKKREQKSIRLRLIRTITTKL
jgi:hypothetical protein